VLFWLWFYSVLFLSISCCDNCQYYGSFGGVLKVQFVDYTADLLLTDLNECGKIFLMLDVLHQSNMLIRAFLECNDF